MSVKQEKTYQIKYNLMGVIGYTVMTSENFPGTEAVWKEVFEDIILNTALMTTILNITIEHVVELTIS